MSNEKCPQSYNCVLYFYTIVFLPEGLKSSKNFSPDSFIVARKKGTILGQYYNIHVCHISWRVLTQLRYHF